MTGFIVRSVALLFCSFALCYEPRSTRSDLTSNNLFLLAIPFMPTTNYFMIRYLLSCPVSLTCFPADRSINCRCLTVSRAFCHPTLRVSIKPLRGRQPRHGNRYRRVLSGWSSTTQENVAIPEGADSLLSHRRSLF
ncbi:hypothetical protein B0T09DRAFT_65341 [Sordaria sp. MPI-SDFR-AT-0083]|nr:hypothetical protein B0T09DRAFT_65341 [Sordaria sp. MPI-SDFR-AT-0083]